jgi:hypothetical protein
VRRGVIRDEFISVIDYLRCHVGVIIERDHDGPGADLGMDLAEKITFGIVGAVGCCCTVK